MFMIQACIVILKKQTKNNHSKHSLTDLDVFKLISLHPFVRNKMKGSVSHISSRQMGLMGSLQVLNLQTLKKKQIIL